jgi:dephospho-CoA kinase
MGQPGSGKSHLARHLSDALGVPHLDIAAQGGHLVDPASAWGLLRRAMGGGPAIVETAGTSVHERGFWSGRRTFDIVVSAPEDVRRERLQRRPEVTREPGYLRRMLAIPTPPAGGVSWLGTTPVPGPAFDELVETVRGVIHG